MGNISDRTLGLEFARPALYSDLVVETYFNKTIYWKKKNYKRLPEQCFASEINGRPFVKQPTP